MTNSKTTKKALLSSALALTMCVAMLIATTFAWFTDTASTSVNKIQAGTLDVDIVDASNTNTSLAGKTLTWVQAASDNTKTQVDGKDILWEPGCTYQLQPFKVVNKGNLAIKYAIKITGIAGDAELNQAINWTMTIGDDTLNIENGEYTILEQNGMSDEIVIKGHMKEEAGNEYQGKSIDGIAITVYATQLASEFDSQNNTYDEGAFDALKALYPVSASAKVTDSGAKINTDTVKVDVPKGAIVEGADNVSVNVTKSADVNSKFTLQSDEGMTLQQFDVQVTGIKENISSDDDAIEVKMFIGKGYSFKDADNLTVQHLLKDGSATENLTGSYDTSTGLVTFKTKSFSPFAVATPNVDAVSGSGTDTTYYANLSNAITKVNEIKLLRDATISDEGKDELKIDKSLTIDLNNYTLTYTGKSPINVKKNDNTETTFTLKNGKFVEQGDRKANQGIIVNYANTTTVLDGVIATTDAALLYPYEDASAVTVKNSNITAGAYGIGTNNSEKNKTSIKITVEDSIVTANGCNDDNCAVMMNVGGTLNITNSKITGDRQGVFLRNGIGTITGSTIKTTGKYSKDDGYLEKWWGGGNNVPCGALIVGTYTSNTNSYAGDATCTLTDTTLIGGNNVREIMMAASAGRTTKVTSDSKIGTVYAMDDDNEDSKVYAPGCSTLVYNGTEVNYS